MKFPPDICRTLWRAVSLCLATTAAWGQGARGQGGEEPSLRLDSIQFYEHGETLSDASDAASEGKGTRPDYASQFAISRARYLAGRVVFENLHHAQGTAEYEVTIGLYTFDNQLVGANKKRLAIDADWKFAWVSQSYGWSEPGRWSPGTYRLKVWVGEEKAGEAAVYLQDDQEAIPPGLAEVNLGEVSFFEGGGFFRPGPAELAATKFARSRARRIYWVVRGENKLQGVRAHRPNIVGYYYHPDGTLLGETANRFVVAPEVGEVVLVEGLGWATPGNWEPGRYRFELEQDHRVVARKTFEVTDPFLKPRERPRVVHYGVIDAGVFAGAGEEPPDAPGREYENTFSATDARYIWCELVVVNNPNHTQAHSHEVSWQYYRPDGALMGKVETEFVIQPEWKTARQKASFGWPQAGKWRAGAYKVRILVDGELARVVRFEVK